MQALIYGIRAGGQVITSIRTSLEPGKVEALVVINRNKGQLNK